MVSIDPKRRVQEVKRERLLAFRQAGFLGFLLSSMVLVINPILEGHLVEHIVDVMVVLQVFAIVSIIVVTYLLRSLDEI